MFGVLIYRHCTFIIRIYDVHSGTHTRSHPVEGEVIGGIRTHGGCLRFATIKSGSITTWEVGFASRNPSTEIESLPLPKEFPHDSNVHAFHPTLLQLAFSHLERIFVWDVRRSKFLLDERAKDPYGISFSSDGHFFMHGTDGSGIYLWKESPTGYILHRNLNHETGMDHQLMSPNEESIFLFDLGVIQLSRTMDPSTSFSRRQPYQRFKVEFSPDETLAAVARFKGETITVLDLKSGDPLSTIDAGMWVCGQRAAGNTVVAFDSEKAVTWNPPARGRVLNPKANVKDSRTATIRCPRMRVLQSASISPDLHSIAMVERNYSSASCFLHLHDVPTGRCLVSVPIRWKTYSNSWFTPDGCQVWCIADDGEARGFTIVEGSKSGVIKLEPTNQPPNTSPWLSSRGYQITDDGWILGISGKRLFRLPLHWRSSDTTRRTWSGRFLALLDRQLPEVVILELEE
ncbi:hypothetical protein BDM02DRAFT_1952662 [Thelephora ganbajun]|uniref:Uncharacterized protein n=1 Tax=Thelephora ganbajun TaxID=370292 RepID=A0ACB6YZL4_THEGA|nr:hypothetical protein BDM02DRAFT_1952662 [Thelephora ganbajun]